MAKFFTIKLIEASSDFPQWTAVDPTTDTLLLFDNAATADEFASELNNSAWALWDADHKNASTDEELWATDHAPAFVGTEFEED